MLIDQISLQPYDVGTIIIPIFTSEETEPHKGKWQSQNLDLVEGGACSSPLDWPPLKRHATEVGCLVGATETLILIFIYNRAPLLDPLSPESRLGKTRLRFLIPEIGGGSRVSRI